MFSSFVKELDVFILILCMCCNQVKPTVVWNGSHLILQIASVLELTIMTNYWLYFAYIMILAAIDWLLAESLIFYVHVSIMYVNVRLDMFYLILTCILISRMMFCEQNSKLYYWMKQHKWSVHAWNRYKKRFLKQWK